MFIGNPRSPNPQIDNFIVFRQRNQSTNEVEEKTLSLADLLDCGLLKNNLVAPVPTELLASEHADFNHDGQPDLNERHFDHEFGGFSIPLTFEYDSQLPSSPLYRKALSPGVYNVKIVIQDVGANGDPFIDSAAFIGEHSLKLFALNAGDYNGNGIVDAADYAVWRHNRGKTPATFYDGDGNGDCIVNNDDYNVWRSHFGETGNGDFSADFDRDGCVDGVDFLNWQLHAGMMHCASRFEGDADSDGDVDSVDLAIWQAQVGSGCGGSSPSFASTGATMIIEGIPESPDVNGDGSVDESDLVTLDQIILREGNDRNAVPTIEPVLAEP